MSAKELFQGIIDGRLPHLPISEILSFWIVEIRGWLRGVRG